MDTMLKISMALMVFIASCSIVTLKKDKYVYTVTGKQLPDSNEIWLTHEHILVDFIGADSIHSLRWQHDEVIKNMLPYLEALKEHGVTYFVDATPSYLGRDAVLLEKISQLSEIKIITNTGFYGAYNNKYVPSFAKSFTAEQYAKIWIDEFNNGIDNTTIRPGFIKIAIDAKDTLSDIHQNIVKAAALTHLKTGLTIASHTGKAIGLWPQLNILKESGVRADALIWVHAQAEENYDNYRKAASEGCWISFDGIGWEIEPYVEKLVYAKENNFLHRILLSHDAGWFDPQKKEQNVKPFTTLFTQLIPMLKSKGFTDDELILLLRMNPSKAFAINVKRL